MLQVGRPGFTYPCPGTPEGMYNNGLFVEVLCLCFVYYPHRD